MIKKLEIGLLYTLHVESINGNLPAQTQSVLNEARVEFVIKSTSLSNAKLMCLYFKLMLIVIKSSLAPPAGIAESK